MSDETRILEMDKYEYGVVFHSLNDKRNELLREQRSTDAVDEVLLKVIDAPTKKEKKNIDRGER